MYTKSTRIVNKSGLHARPASDFIQAATKFQSRIEIAKVGSDTFANAKSIIFLLGLGLSQGAEILLRAEGTDEEQAVNTLIQLIESGFGEV